VGDVKTRSQLSGKVLFLALSLEVEGGVAIHARFVTADPTQRSTASPFSGKRREGCEAYIRISPLPPIRAKFFLARNLAAHRFCIQDKRFYQQLSHFNRRYPHAIMATKTIQAAEAALPAAVEAVVKASRPVMFKKNFGNKQIFLFVSSIPSHNPVPPVLLMLTHWP
jgi:hypothetical protein